MKKAISMLLALAMLICAAPAAFADDSDPDGLELVRALGILVGYEDGDLDLGGSVTRAQFTKMMIMSSSYRDSVGGGSGYSVFSDVKSTHWASEYIRTAVDEGWVVGYVDGTFKPEGRITLEEACSALLKMLGYDSSSLSGSFPTAQLNKASSIGLLDGVDAQRGDELTRGQCVTLFANLLTCENASGTVYATTIGLTVTNGEVDYSSVISADTHGPFVAGASGANVPFDGSMTVYRDGALSTLGAIKQYDVYYYHTGLRTVWAYSDKAVGTITALSPSAATPTSVTLAGKTYSIGTSSAAYKLSSQGEFHVGDTATLLLGMNGEVVDVVSSASVSGEYYGVVLTSSNTTSSSGSSVEVLTTVACTDGVERSFYHSGSEYDTGDLVRVNISDSGTTVRGLSSRDITGKVSDDGESLGSTDFADGVQIIDVDGEGGWARIYPSRLAGYTLRDSDVSYYQLNDDGEISILILNNSTGDTATYGYITDANEVSMSDSMNISGTYTCFIGGSQRVITSSNRIFNVSEGGAAITYASDGSIKSMRNLDSVRVQSISSLTADTNDGEYKIAEDAQVLLMSSGDCFVTELSSINTTDYTVTGWYDNGGSAGGIIRVITAVEK